MASVSVVVLCRNQRSNLGQILDALDSQTLRPAEVIIADDRSEEPIETIAAWSGCRYVSTAAHVGQQREGNRALARQLGTATASHPLIAYLDGDIVPSLGFLEIGAAVAQRGLIARAPRRARIVPPDQQRRQYSEECLSFANFTSDSFIAPLHEVHDAGGWDDRFEGWGEEDIEFAYRCEGNGLPLVQVEHPAFFGYHLDHPVRHAHNFVSLVRNAAYFAQKHPAIVKTRATHWESLDVYLTHYRSESIAP